MEKFYPIQPGVDHLECVLPFWDNFIFSPLKYAPGAYFKGDYQFCLEKW